MWASSGVMPMKKKILVIEDDNLLRDYIKNVLEEDYDVLGADNGKDGMSLAMLHNPDLIILDLVMPHMSGYHFLSVLNEKKLKPRIIVLTGTQSSNRDVLDTSNILDIVQKPFTIKSFLQTIKSHIQ